MPLTSTFLLPLLWFQSESCGRGENSALQWRREVAFLEGERKWGHVTMSWRKARDKEAQEALISQGGERECACGHRKSLPTRHRPPLTLLACKGIYPTLKYSHSLLLGWCQLVQNLGLLLKFPVPNQQKCVALIRVDLGHLSEPSGLGEGEGGSRTVLFLLSLWTHPRHLVPGLQSVTGIQAPEAAGGNCRRGTASGAGVPLVSGLVQVKSSCKTGGYHPERLLPSAHWPVLERSSSLFW